MRVVLATYNVHGCVGTDRRRDPRRVLDVIRELDADAVALQELMWDPADARHLLEEFAHRLGCEAIAGPTLMREGGHFGNALLTRLPVTGSTRIDLSFPGREPRGAIDATLETADGPLRVVATHLGLSPAERRGQIRRLLGCLSEPDFEPAALLGDLNEWYLWGRPLRWLRSHFGRSPAPATFPARRPVFALDRVWARPEGALREVRAHASPLARIASDHLPLRAVIAR